MTKTQTEPSVALHAESAHHVKRRRWRPGVMSWLIVVLLIGGSTVLLYPVTASWLTSYNQSQLIERYSDLIDRSNPDAASQLAQAHEYNAALTAGVEVRANSNVPAGAGTLSNRKLDYRSILTVNDEGLMARIKIPKIDVDLPIYHGTEDAALLKGAGHLEGSHFPVGGPGTHSVITAHRGLATATMFTHLDQIEVGDTFTVEVFGEVLSYRVRQAKVVQPEDTDSLRATAGEDLITLITCTPLGINSHRILVTGERVTPAPIEDIRSAGARPEIPGFPWWIVGFVGAMTAAAVYLWWAGFSDEQLRSTGRSRSTAGEPA